MWSPGRIIGLNILILFVGSLCAQAQWTYTPQIGRFINIKSLPRETPELQVEHARSLLVEGNFSAALSETDKFTNFYGDTDVADENQFVRGEIRFAEEQYVKAAQEFQQVLVNYPNTELHDRVIERQYDAGDTLFVKGQDRMEKQKKLSLSPFRKRPFKRAVEVYTLVIDNQPFTEEAAQAQYKIGLCYFTLGDYQSAAVEYKTVIEDYSDSEWVIEATYGMAKCYSEAAYSSEYDQSNGQLAINSAAEFETLYPEDARVSELNEISQNMFERIAEQHLLNAQFYEIRREMYAARIYYETVTSQFSGTEAAKKAQVWLDENPPVHGLEATFFNTRNAN